MKSLNIAKAEIEVYSKEEQQKLMNVAKQDNIYGIVVIFALYTGMRKGEILGLQWQDINFESKTITVNKQLCRLKNYDNYKNKKTILCIQHNTKTSNSNRIVPMSDTLISILKQHYIRQQKNKQILGTKYYNYHMVFCRQDGYYLDPDTVLSKYKFITKKAEIKQCTFHALRHTFATRALESQVPAKIVSNILGHASVQFTLDTYTHVLEDIKLDEINKLDKYINSVAI